MSERARLTVLVCTHNRAALLGRLLDSLNAAHRPEDWEVDVLVVANACSDTTAETLEAYRRTVTARQRLPLDWFAVPTPGKSHALNAALVRIEADWVAFVDDDHRIDAEWFTALARAIEQNPGMDIFCGRVLQDWDGREPAWVHDTGPYRIYPLPIPRQDFGLQARELTSSGPLPGGGNLVVRRDWLARIGPFKTELGPTGHDLGGAEDMDWLKRGLALGARLYYVPEAVQYHYVDLERLRLGYLMRKAYERSASVVVIEGKRTGVPPYLYRKLAGYALGALTGLSAARRRFYLVRCAAALGEIAGHRRRRGAAMVQPSEHRPLY